MAESSLLVSGLADGAVHAISGAWTKGTRSNGLNALMHVPLDAISNQNVLEGVATLIDLATDARFEPGITSAFVYLIRFSAGS